ncbi:Spy/CpxP family protein refolding chaperone [Marinobacterium sp. AK62]|uniref:Spy/CpxP family protein refolding chaperone n=1 Tax=Marinobacterium alkalitolerans TaxID=1542925 RepID=A0ABS3Z7C7_9GAMM|nr:Spy/CpxP family protein refolding chaperone [Marinobacterium alkalitolerans]MBP0047143.1 Spy/CpxP family protein refolding chaperone [Marinobacterium alkalitolerans]
MKTRKWVVTTLALSLVAGSSALAYAGQKEGCDKGMQRAERHADRLAERLDLDPAQTASLKALFNDQAAQRADHPGQGKRMHGLQALDPNAADYQQQVQALITEMQQQLAERIQARASFQASLYAILTPEQEQKMAELQARKAAHRGHGHGH